MAAAPATPFRGRPTEFGEVTAALDRAASGRRSVVLIDGEAGIGKSRLLEEAATSASSRGFAIAAAEGDEMEQSRPFGLIADALGCTRTASDPRRAAIAELLNGHTDARHGPVTVSNDPGLRFRVVDALCDLVVELAGGEPLFIALDDLQWADPATLVTLVNLSSATTGLPVALFAGHRLVPWSPWLRSAIDSLDNADATHVSLDRLDEDAVHAIVADLLGDEPDSDVLTAVAGATGNPLFVIELVQSIRSVAAHDRPAGDDPRPAFSSATLPDSVRLTILQRLSSLPEATLDALRFASLLGSAFSPVELAVVGSHDIGDLVPALETAIAANVLEEHGAGLRFRHDLIRDAIYSDMTPTLRAALHREAALRLSQTAASPGRVADQFARGAVPGDTEAVDWLARAGRAALTTSPETAVDYFARAAELTDDTDPVRIELLTERADALMRAGAVTEAIDASRAVIDASPPSTATPAARVRLGAALLVNGRPGEALVELESARRCAADDPNRPDVVTGLGEAAFAKLWLADFDGADEIAQRAQPAAIAVGDHATATTCLSIRSVTACMRGDLYRAMELNDAAIDLADASPGRSAHGNPVYATRGWILLETDRLDEARRALDHGRRLSEELGVRWPLATYQAYLAVVRFSAGAWDDAVTELEAGIDFAEESGVTYALKPAHSALTLIRLHRNDLTGARDVVENASALGDRGSLLFDYRLLWAHALLLEAEGDPFGAYTLLADRWQRCHDVGMGVDYPVVGPDLVRLACGVSERALAEQVAGAVAEVADAVDVPSIDGAALRCAGLLDDDPALLARAVDAYAAGPRPLETASTAEEAADAMLRAGMSDRARAFLEQASKLYDGLDATRGQARVDAALRDLGVRRGKRGRRGRPRWGWEALTPTETNVAELVAEGMTNPQIAERLYVSRRTVQTHVSHIFTKLEIGSRARLATLVAEHRASPEQTVRSARSGTVD